jgi:hypothetical protein
MRLLLSWWNLSRERLGEFEFEFAPSCEQSEHASSRLPSELMLTNSIYVPDDGYLAKVSEICKKYNVLLICDEIQTGLCRTGKM